VSPLPHDVTDLPAQLISPTSTISQVLMILDLILSFNYNNRYLCCLIIKVSLLCICSKLNLNFSTATKNFAKNLGL
jgi:hypothetical protein